MGRGKKNRKERALKAGLISSPDMPAIVYRMPVDRTKPTREPNLIPPDAFQVIADIMLQTAAPHRNVFLSMCEYRIQDINPSHKETSESPTHMIIFCLRLLVTDQFHPIGVVQIDKRIDQSDKLVHVWKTFIQDLSILRLIVIGTISPPSKTFHRVLSKLTKIPNMKHYTGPITYSVWPYTDIVHLYDYYYLLHETQETLFERNEMYFMSCPPSEKSPPALELLTASWTDILLVLTSQGINCYYTSEDRDASPLAIFFADFWETYQQAGRDGLMDTDSKESTDRLMELLCPFATRLRAFKPFMCPCDLQIFYEYNEQLRILLATAQFKKLNMPYSNRSSPQICIDTNEHIENTITTPCTSKSNATVLTGICNTKTGGSIEISGNQMENIFNIIDSSINDVEMSFDRNSPSPFDTFLQKITLDGYDLFLKTSSKQTCARSPLKDLKRPKEVNNISHDHDYLISEVPKKAPSNASVSSIYKLVNDYFEDAVKQHKESLRETESKYIYRESSTSHAPMKIIQNKRQPHVTMHHGSTATENDAISSKNVAGDQNIRNIVLKSPLDDPSMNLSNSQNIGTLDGYQQVSQINTATSIDEKNKTADTNHDKTSKIKGSKIGKLVHDTGRSKKAKAKRLRNRESVQKLVISLPFILVESQESIDPDKEEKTEDTINKCTILTTRQEQNVVNVSEITSPEKEVCTINIFPSASNIPDNSKTDDYIHTDVPARNANEVYLRIKIRNNIVSKNTDDRSINNASPCDKKKGEIVPINKNNSLLDNSPKSILNSAIQDFSNILVSYKAALDISNNNKSGNPEEFKQSVNLTNQSKCELEAASSPTLHIKSKSKNLSDQHDDLDLQGSDSDSIDSLTELLTSIEANSIPTKIPCKYTLQKTPRCLKNSPKFSALHSPKHFEDSKDAEALKNIVVKESTENHIVPRSAQISSPGSLEEFECNSLMANNALHENTDTMITSTTPHLNDLDVNNIQVALKGSETVASPIEDSLPELVDYSLAEENSSGCLDSKVDTKSILEQAWDRKCHTSNAECENNSKCKHVMPCCRLASTSGHSHGASSDVDNKPFLPHYTRFRKSFGDSTSSCLSCKSPLCPKESSLQDENHSTFTSAENLDDVFVGESTALILDLTLDKSSNVDGGNSKDKYEPKESDDCVESKRNLKTCDNQDDSVKQYVDGKIDDKDKPEIPKEYVEDEKNKISLETCENQELAGKEHYDVRKQYTLENSIDCEDDKENMRSLSPESCNNEEIYIRELGDEGYKPPEPNDYVEYKEYKRSLETCDNPESKCDIIYKDRKRYEGLYSQIPDDFETMRLTTDWLCTFKGYLKLKEILVARKVRQFQASALSLEHIDFFVHLIKRGRNKTSSVYQGQSYRLLDHRLAFDLFTLGKGVYVIKNDEHGINNISL